MKALLALVGLTLALAASAQPIPVCPFVWDAVPAKNPNGSTTAWSALCSSDPRDGGGGFLQFLTPNKAGAFVAGVNLNGGLVSATTGNEQGDIDIGFYLDGKPATISVTGRYQANLPGLLMWPPDQLYLGSPTNRWAGLYETEYHCPAGVPGNPSFCIKANGGYLPVYGAP